MNVLWLLAACSTCGEILEHGYSNKLDLQAVIERCHYVEWHSKQEKPDGTKCAAAGIEMRAPTEAEIAVLETVINTSTGEKLR